MWKLRMCVFAATGVFALGMGAAAWADGNPHDGGNSSAASNSGGQGNGKDNGKSQAGGGASGNSQTGRQSAGNGDSNSGDVWLDSSTNPGPGHEMDPHLGCPTTIYMYGSHMADSSGTYTIDGWPPSGSKKVDYSGKWSYSGTGTQTIATIDVQTLLKQAAANGDTPAAQGYHFKLNLSQDPQKHKVFWINCGTSSSPTTHSSTSSETTCEESTTSEDNDTADHGKDEGREEHGDHANHGKHKGELKHEESNESSSESSSSTCNSSSQSTNTAAANNMAPTPTSSPTTTNTSTTSTVSGTSTVNSSVKGAHAKRHARKRRLVSPKRHTKPRRRSVSAVSVAAPAFTG